MSDNPLTDARYFDDLLEDLLCALLKFSVIPGQRSWSSVKKIELLKWKLYDELNEHTVLNVRIMHRFAKLYFYARVRASLDTGFPESIFPETCPWRIPDILDVNIYQI